MGTKDKGFKFQLRASDVARKRPTPRTSTGGYRKIAFLGGAKSIKYAPWHDLSWELWSHASCRHLCKRDPDALFDLHPPELFRDPKMKTWDPKYLAWLRVNHIPIYMQEAYEDIPAAIQYPFATMITEFPRGYMTNHVAYMTALALMEGARQIAVYGCDYDTGSEYGPQRGSAEYWLGLAEGRGVIVTIAPECSLLKKPLLLYGYESHPKGKRDPSYSFAIGPSTVKKTEAQDGGALIPADDPKAPPLRWIGQAPALERRDGLPAEITGAK